MKISCRLMISALVLAGPLARASNESLVTSVYSNVSNGYHRQQLPDGSVQPEYYALANGIYTPGLGRDHSIDAVRFPQMAKVVAQLLALKNYHLAPDAKTADLLLLITWGTTVPHDDAGYRTNAESMFSAAHHLVAATAAVKASENAGHRGSTTDGIQSPLRSVRDEARDSFEGELLQMQMFNDVRRAADERNARLLGYVDAINQLDTPAQFAGAGAARDDLVTDLETERYYVIISAYDFRAAKEGGKQKLLWSTRVSIQAQGNKFNEAVTAMLARASRYFGQDSGRLLRQYQPEGKVSLAELQIVGVVAPTEMRDSRANAESRAAGKAAQ